MECPLCAGRARVLSTDHPGYRKPEIYTIAECDFCDLQFATPRPRQTTVYEDIYRNARTLPGYSRYAAYADAVTAAPRPLDWLAEREDMYWFVRESLRELGADATTRILELGSGLGYLTMALRRSGYDARGLDVSPSAMRMATDRFGPYYDLGDVNDPTTLGDRQVDIVILTEVIEHVPEPAKLLASVHAVLRPGGHALLTTPNKSLFAQGAYWGTENPPVHLWWFSETAIRRLAQSRYSAISFCDFRRYYLPPAARRRHRTSPAPRPPYLDEHGVQVVHAPGAEQSMKSEVASRLELLVEQTGLPGLQYRRAWRHWRRHGLAGLRRSGSMGVLLRT